MKRFFTLVLALAGCTFTAAHAQQQPAGAAAVPPPPPAKVHGHVSNPTGAPQHGGEVGFVEAGKPGDKATLPVNDSGDYSGEVPPGTYTIVYRDAGMAKTTQADFYENVKIAPGGDVTQDFDMSRQEYIDKLPDDQKKMLADMKAKNSEALKANEVIKALNSDLATVSADFKAVDSAHTDAATQLGATAAKTDIDAKANEIRTAKYTDVETLMTKDTGVRPDEPILWAYLGQAQVGLKKYDEAAVSYKKALDADTASKKPNPALEGMVNSGIGEVYARTGKVPDANAAYDAAAKANPPQAGTYYRNQAVIFFQLGNSDAQIAAADIALKTNPNDAILYYLKGQGLVSKATIDPKTQRIVLPDGCAEAYQKYLELAPTGPYAADAQGILAQAGQKVDTGYKAGKPAKGK